MIDKPEIIWEHPNLERLYLRLEDEFEIRERHLALERKLNLVSHTAQTVLGSAAKPPHPAPGMVRRDPDPGRNRLERRATPDDDQTPVG